MIWKNGDGSTLDTRTYKGGEAEPTTDKIPTRKEDNTYTFRFIGWDEGKIVGNTKIYTPRFTAEKKDGSKTTIHTVTFYTSGGSYVAPQYIEDGKTAIRPEDPKKDGFVFIGWYTDATYVSTFDFSKPIKDNTIVFAQWKDQTPTAQASYNVPDEETLEWTKGSSAGYTFTVHRSVDDANSFSHFTGVQLDGTTLINGTDYIARPGSTVITLSSAVMERMAPGQHKIRVVFDDGSVEKALEVNASGTKSANAANTGDNSHMILWICLLAIGVVGIILALRYRSRHKEDVK